jgi:peptide/nickel transport system substrate-binding protein
MTEKNQGVSVKFARNENYWQPGKPYLDGIEYHNITDQMTQNAALLSKGADKIDVFNGASGEQLQVLNADPDLTIHAFPSGNLSIWPSSRNEDSPFAKLEVRQAISYAIDRQALSEARGFGFMNPSSQFIVSGYYGHFYDERNFFSYDPAKSKELLAAAGYPNGFATDWFASVSMDRDLTVAITEMLAVVGIKCEIDIAEAARITQMRNNGWEGLLFNTFGNLPSLPGTFRLNFDPAYLFNVSTWRPPGYAEDFVKLGKTKTYDQGLGEICHSWIADYMIVIPVLERANSYVVRNSVHDAEFGHWGMGTQWVSENTWMEQ